MKDPLRTLLSSYKRYLEKHGERIISICEITGQEEVTTTIESLYWYHDSSYGYSRLDDAIRELLQDEEKMKELKAKGIVLSSDGKLLKVKLNVIRQLMGK
ncbi:MAG: hypothetical protein DRN15_01880 [Thermoprotei archaeon]|nr:MAG: hypothetical protein DRN15_01880 [Thermoprotei archaeon]